jgi:hypothetical protein
VLKIFYLLLLFFYFRKEQKEAPPEQKAAGLSFTPVSRTTLQTFAGCAAAAVHRLRKEFPFPVCAR